MYLRVVMAVDLLNDNVPSFIERFRFLQHFDSLFFADARIGSEVLAKLRESVDYSLKRQRVVEENLKDIGLYCF